MAVRKVIIVGGGVAGAGTALALRRAGIEAVVYEAHASGGADAGAFLTVMENGMRALGRLDAVEAVVAASYPSRAVALVDAEGEQQGRRPIGGGARSTTRAALYAALQQLAVARGIRVEHGKRMVAAEDRDGRAVVSFADGSTDEGDVLVGADGLHSLTRRLIDPAAPSPRYTGQHVIYGYAPGNPAGAPLDEYVMVRGSRAFFGFTVPDGDGRTWWFARISGDVRAARTTPGQWRSLALEAFRADRAPAAAIIEATADAQVVGQDSHDIPTTPRWHNGRFVLAGDAAHAAAPAAAQGASMALEDAVVLGETLSGYAEAGAALRAYEQRRRSEAEETVAASAALNGR